MAQLRAPEIAVALVLFMAAHTAGRLLSPGSAHSGVVTQLVPPAVHPVDVEPRTAGTPGSVQDHLATPHTQMFGYIRSTAGCSDQSTKCAAWKRSGLCSPGSLSSGQSVPTYWCPNTCGTCCVDRYSGCESWKTSGYCDSSYYSATYSVASYWCRKTCSTCEAGNADVSLGTPSPVASTPSSPPPPQPFPPRSPPPSPPPPPRPLPSPPGCIDRYQGCAYWKQIGLCPTLAAGWCPKTCNACGANSTMLPASPPPPSQSPPPQSPLPSQSPPPQSPLPPQSPPPQSPLSPQSPPPQLPTLPPSPVSGCYDQSDLCQAWKDAGYCTDKQYESTMVSSCPVTCGRCATALRPPAPPSPPPSNVGECNNGEGMFVPLASNQKTVRALSQEPAVHLGDADTQPSVLVPRYLPHNVRDTATAQPRAGGATRQAAGNRRLMQTEEGKPIKYHGGPVMSGFNRVHLIWYGNWPADTPTKPLIEDFVANLGCTSWWRMMKPYCDNTGACVGGLALGASVFVKGESLYVDNITDVWSTGSVWGIVSSAINKGLLGQTDSHHDLFLVFPSADIKLGLKFEAESCGWHYPRYDNDVTWKYGLIGNPAGRDVNGNPVRCVGTTQPPNEDFQADNMVPTLAHEIAEAVSDPEITAWFDDDGEENADKCSWSFGALNHLPNGAPWNLQVGSKYWLVQQNWNLDKKACAMEP